VKFEEIGMIDDIKFITGIINSPLRKTYTELVKLRQSCTKSERAD